MKAQRNILREHREWFFLLLLALGLVWIFASRVSADMLVAGALPQPYEGFPAPDIELATADGNMVKLSDLRGQPIILNFWASWCPPCRAEMPAIQAVYQAYHNDGLIILAVNASNQDDLTDANAFVTGLQLSFPIYFDKTGNAQDAYKVSALPTTFFIDRDGIIQSVVIGGPIAEALLNVKAQALLEEQP